MIAKTTASLIWTAVFAAAFAVGFARTGLAEETADPSVRLYDTGTPAAAALTPEAVAARAGWVQVPADHTTHAFRGDVAFANDRLVIVVRAKGAGPEVYTLAGKQAAWWARLAPVRQAGAAATPVRIVENTPGAVAVADAGAAGVTLRLTTGQPYIEVRPGEGVDGIDVECGPLSQVIVPEFFGDDMAFAPQATGLRPIGLPAESVVLGLGGSGDRITVCVWKGRGVTVETAGAETAGAFGGWRLRGIAGATVWLAVLQGPGLWHARAMAADDGGKTLGLPWTPPYAAKWRCDLTGADFLTASSTSAGPSSAEEFAGADARANPLRFAAGAAAVQAPLGGTCRGLLVYLLDRSRATPLTEFTPVDILRNTLGVGPCQYILETEGLATGENPTPDQVMTWTESQFRKGKDAKAADEIRGRLKAMSDLVARTQTRIKQYADFAAGVRAATALEKDAAGQGALAQALAPTLLRLRQSAETGLAATDPPERVGKLADDVAALIGKENALARVQELGNGFRAIGAAQDESLANDRMAVRWLREQCRTAASGTSAEAAQARRIQDMAERFLQGK